jgi:hypothetical protein
MTAMNRVVFVLAAAALGACAFDPRGQSVSPDASDDQDAADPDATSDPDAADPDATPDPDAGAGPDATPDPDAGTGPDAGPLTGRMMIDDTAADFGRDGPTYVETRVEAAGAVAPRAYYQGSLCAGGSNSRLFDDGTTATWAVIPATPSKYGLSRTVDLNLPSGGFPAGVGITDGGDWTLWWFGELYLTAGAHNLDLAADDHAFLELAPPGSDSFTTVLGTNVGTVDTATYNAPTTGWYGVRMALAQRGGGVDLYPRLDGVTISRWLTRCRVDAISGLALTGWDEARWNDVRGTTIASADAANVDWGFNRPGDLGITANDTFAVRWAGQFFIATGGTYRLQVESDDGYRLWIDGQAIISNLGDGIFDVTTGDLTLATGWHDVVYDTTESALGAKSRLSIASGPDGAGPFPAARLRPGRGPRRALRVGHRRRHQRRRHRGVHAGHAERRGGHRRRHRLPDRRPGRWRQHHHDPAQHGRQHPARVALPLRRRRAVRADRVHRRRPDRHLGSVVHVEQRRLVARVLADRPVPRRRPRPDPDHRDLRQLGPRSPDDRRQPRWPR